MSVLVFRQVPHEHLGTIALSLDAKGIPYRCIDFYDDRSSFYSLDEFKGLIILGGPMNVYETDRYPFLALEERAIGEAINAGKPVLGVCLGAQLIAKVLGARVYPAREKEIGWYEIRLTEEGRRDGLLGSLSPCETVFEWHGDTFDLPDGAFCLAESEACKNQAFRFGDSVYGLQFHLEVTAEMVSTWLAVEENRMEIEALSGRINPDGIIAETATRIGSLRTIADRVFGSFCDLISRQYQL
ncbi:MAG: hypothetical protein QXI19_05695 [Candidatus Caldarchaeum sp.]